MPPAHAPGSRAGCRASEAPEPPCIPLSRPLTFRCRRSARSPRIWCACRRWTGGPKSTRTWRRSGEALVRAARVPPPPPAPPLPGPHTHEHRRELHPPAAARCRRSPPLPPITCNPHTLPTHQPTHKQAPVPPPPMPHANPAMKAPTYSAQATDPTASLPFGVCWRLLGEGRHPVGGDASSLRRPSAPTTPPASQPANRGWYTRGLCPLLVRQPRCPGARRCCGR